MAAFAQQSTQGCLLGDDPTQSRGFGGIRRNGGMKKGDKKKEVVIKVEENSLFGLKPPKLQQTNKT